MDPIAIVAVSALLGVLDKATGGVFAEYIKWAWFRRIHPTRDPEADIVQLALERAKELEAAREVVERALRRAEDLQAEIIRLRLANATLRDQVRQLGAEPMA
jgi:hypothetical protein